ncbi:unnamed protein product [Owenia fusiformis]|uniref:Exonuclease domain-containing protein n=1 Tax=Owenia fusiformis TaxID=6347 RepID=A0A8S4N5A8_OWEFU|nr:unnamed protein product [Owenia fusiformis]
MISHSILKLSKSCARTAKAARLGLLVELFIPNYTVRMASSSSEIKRQNFDYFLVLDFEATCDNPKNPFPQEIIELPILKVNGQTFEVESQFHQYVQPRVHAELTPFCTELTGIIQEMVDGQPHIEETLQSVDKWMLENGLLEPGVKSVFVTCGDWDLRRMLPSQCNHFNIPIPTYFNKWINIKRAFSDSTGMWPSGMIPMLEPLGLRHQGRHHSGIDDCKNIANILKAVAERGHVFQVTGTSVHLMTVSLDD